MCHSTIRYALSAIAGPFPHGAPSHPPRSTPSPTFRRRGPVCPPKALAARVEEESPDNGGLPLVPCSGAAGTWRREACARLPLVASEETDCLSGLVSLLDRLVP